jgi:hypothetical protein
MKSKWKKILIRVVPLLAIVAVVVELEDDLSQLTGRKWL